jgi:hypothetical protein
MILIVIIYNTNINFTDLNSSYYNININIAVIIDNKWDNITEGP